MAARPVAIDNREVRPDGFHGIEGHRQRKEQPACGGLESGVAGRQVLLDQRVERALVVDERPRHVRVDVAATVAGVQSPVALERLHDAGDGVGNRLHFLR